MLQNLFTYLSRRCDGGALGGDEDAYRAAADVSNDGAVDILDIEALYVIRAQRRKRRKLYPIEAAQIPVSGSGAADAVAPDRRSHSELITATEKAIYRDPGRYAQNTTGGGLYRQGGPRADVFRGEQRRKPVHKVDLRGHVFFTTRTAGSMPGGGCQLRTGSGRRLRCISPWEPGAEGDPGSTAADETPWGSDGVWQAVSSTAC